VKRDSSVRTLAPYPDHGLLARFCNPRGRKTSRGFEDELHCTRRDLADREDEWNTAGFSFPSIAADEAHRRAVNKRNAREIDDQRQTFSKGC
jgi:hypothetical protein